MGAAQVLIGDVNSDGLVNNFDIDAFVSLLLSGSASGQCARRFEYDEENRLTKVSALAGGDAHALLEISYDALGRRVETRDYADNAGGPAAGCEPLEAPAVTRHVYDGIQPVEEFIWEGGTGGSSGQWSLAREFLWGERFPEPLALITHGGESGGLGGPGVPPGISVFHYVHDALGSVVALLDAGDPNATPAPIPPKVVERYTYDPYGRTVVEAWNPAANSGAGAFEPVTASGLGNPFAWTGQRYDAGVGLYNFR